MDVGKYVDAKMGIQNKKWWGIQNDKKNDENYEKGKHLGWAYAT